MSKKNEKDIVSAEQIMANIEKVSEEGFSDEVKPAPRTVHRVEWGFRDKSNYWLETDSYSTARHTFEVIRTNEDKNLVKLELITNTDSLEGKI